MELATQTHLRTIRHALRVRLSELGGLQDEAWHSRLQTQATEGHTVTDQKDQADQQAASTVDDAAQRLERSELARIEAALERLEAGHYGDCQDCGDPIPWQRLQVQPAAERCAACQTAVERQHLRQHM